jgi:hypothetical protein
MKLGECQLGIGNGSAMQLDPDFILVSDEAHPEPAGRVE